MNRRAAAGFTLIELLIVIAVVALLVGVLLPALGKARRSAQQAVSGSNMRQLSAVVASYALEHKDAYVNPFDPNASCSIDGFIWTDVIHPDLYARGIGQLWHFGDNARSTEMFAAHWASLAMNYVEPGALDSAVQWSPADRTALSRRDARRAQVEDRAVTLHDTSYFYSPTFWFRPERYLSTSFLPVPITAVSMWRRNRTDEVTHPQAKVLLFERFDFAQDTRQGPNGTVRQNPTWNNAGATARFALADGSIGSVPVRDLNALTAHADVATRAAFTPPALWDVSQTLLARFGLENDGLENGSPGTRASSPFFWATRRGIKGRDLNR